MEGEAVGVLDASRVDAAAGEDGFVLGGEVTADDADDTNAGEVGGGEGEVGGGATEDLFGFAGGGGEGVKGDGADYEDGHASVWISLAEGGTLPPYFRAKSSIDCAYVRTADAPLWGETACAHRIPRYSSIMPVCTRRVRHRCRAMMSTVKEVRLWEACSDWRRTTTSRLKAEVTIPFRERSYTGPEEISTAPELHEARSSCGIWMTYRVNHKVGGVTLTAC